MNVKTKDASPAAQDYMGMGKKKLGDPRGSRHASPSPGRFESQTKGAVAAEEIKDELDDEMRSIHAELDYTRKDATRHIV